MNSTGREAVARKRLQAQVATFLTAAVVCAGGYLLLLGWHNLQDYREWRVLCLAALLALTVAMSTHLSTGLGIAVAVAVTVIMTTLWSIDAASDPAVEQPSLWGVGAIEVFVDCAGASALVVLLAHRLRMYRVRRRR